MVKGTGVFPSLVAAWALTAFVPGLGAEWAGLHGPMASVPAFPPGMVDLFAKGDSLYAYGHSGIWASRIEPQDWHRWDDGKTKGQIRDFKACEGGFAALADSAFWYCSPNGDCVEAAHGLPPVSKMAVTGSRVFLLTAGPGDVYSAERSSGTWVATRVAASTGGTSIAANQSIVCVNGGNPSSHMGFGDSIYGPYSGWVSSDQGKTWNELANPGFGWAYDLFADQTRLYAASAPGTPTFFFYSQNSGRAWLPLPKDLSLAGKDAIDHFIGFKALDLGLVAVFQGSKYGTNLFLTSDLGAHWQSRKASDFILSGSPERVLLFSPSIGEEDASLDQGFHWAAYGGAQTPCSVRSIVATRDSLCVTGFSRATAEEACTADAGGSWTFSPNPEYELIGDGQGHAYFYDQRNSFGNLPEGISDPYHSLPWNAMFAIAHGDHTVSIGFGGPTYLWVLFQEQGGGAAYRNSGLPDAQGLAMTYLKGNYILATSKGAYRLAEDEALWRPANAGNPRRLEALASEGKKLFAVANGRIVESTDLGSTWFDLPVQASGSAACLAVTRDTLYAGTSNGAWSIPLADIPGGNEDWRDARGRPGGFRPIFTGKGTVLFPQPGRETLRRGDGRALSTGLP